MCKRVVTSHAVIPDSWHWVVQNWTAALMQVFSNRLTVLGKVQTLPCEPRPAVPNRVLGAGTLKI